MYKNLQEFPLLSFLARQSLQVHSFTLVNEARMPFYPNMAYTDSQNANLISGGKVWSGTGSTYSLVQAMQQEHNSDVITLGSDEGFTPRRRAYARQGMIQIKPFVIQEPPPDIQEPPAIQEPQTVMHQTNYHTVERLQNSFVPQSSLTGHHRRARYPASIPNNVPGYVAPVAVTTDNIRGYDMSLMDLRPVRVHAPDATFRCTPCSVHYLPSHQRLESRSMSRFSSDSNDRELCGSFEDKGAHGKTEDMGHVRSFTRNLSWNRRNGSTCDGKTVHREEAGSGIWNSLRRLCREVVGERGGKARQPETPPNTPEDSLHTKTRDIGNRMHGSKRPATSGGLKSIPGYTVKRARTTDGHLLLRQDIPMDFALGPSVRASHQEPPVRVSSRWFPKGKPKTKPFEYPRHTAYFGNKRAGGVGVF